MNIDTLKSLQTRIREATGADRELDRLIVCALLAPEGSRVVHTGVRDEWVIEDKPNRRWWPDDHGVFRLAYNSSLTTYPSGLGDCVALMNEVLPRCLWSKAAFGNFWIHVGLETIYSRRIGGEKLANDCFSFLDAIFSAVIAREEAKETADV